MVLQQHHSCQHFFSAVSTTSVDGADSAGSTTSESCLVSTVSFCETVSVTSTVCLGVSRTNSPSELLQPFLEYLDYDH